MLALWIPLAVCAAADEEEDSEEESEAEESDAEWIPIDVPADFGTALDLPAEVEPDAPRARLRGRWLVRPRLSFTGMEGGGWTSTLGGAVGHQWWVLGDRVVRPVGETRLTATFPVTGKGQDLRLGTTVGLWAGPVGLMVGPVCRWDRLALRAGGEAARAWTLGPRLRVAGQIGPVIPWLSATPTWILSGERLPADLPLGQELELAAGVEFGARPITFRLYGARRQLAQDVLWEGTLGFHLRLL